MTKLYQLKSKILYLEDFIKVKFIELQGKNRVSEANKLAILEAYERLKKLKGSLKIWGIGNSIIEVTIAVGEIVPYQKNSMTLTKTYLIYYDNISEPEAKELIEMHFPKATILKTRQLLTGTKIIQKL